MRVGVLEDVPDDAGSAVWVERETSPRVERRSLRERYSGSVEQKLSSRGLEKCKGLESVAV